MSSPSPRRRLFVVTLGLLLALCVLASVGFFATKPDRPQPRIGPSKYRVIEQDGS